MKQPKSIEDKIKDIVARMASEHPAYTYKQIMQVLAQQKEELIAQVMKAVGEDNPAEGFPKAPAWYAGRNELRNTIRAKLKEMK